MGQAAAPGQLLIKIQEQWDGPFPAENASLQRLTNLVNQLVDAVNPLAPQNNVNQGQQTQVIGVNANGQPARLTVYANGNAVPIANTALSIPGGAL